MVQIRHVIWPSSHDYYVVETEFGCKSVCHGNLLVKTCSICAPGLESSLKRLLSGRAGQSWKWREHWGLIWQSCQELKRVCLMSGHGEEDWMETYAGGRNNRKVRYVAQRMLFFHNIFLRLLFLIILHYKICQIVYPFILLTFRLFCCYEKCSWHTGNISQTLHFSFESLSWDYAHFHIF